MRTGMISASTVLRELLLARNEKAAAAGYARARGYDAQAEFFEESVGLAESLIRHFGFRSEEDYTPTIHKVENGGYAYVRWQAID